MDTFEFEIDTYESKMDTFEFQMDIYESKMDTFEFEMDTFDSKLKTGPKKVPARPKRISKESTVRTFCNFSYFHLVLFLFYAIFLNISI